MLEIQKILQKILQTAGGEWVLVNEKVILIMSPNEN